MRGWPGVSNTRPYPAKSRTINLDSILQAKVQLVRKFRVFSAASDGYLTCRLKYTGIRDGFPHNDNTGLGGHPSGDLFRHAQPMNSAGVCAWCCAVCGWLLGCGLPDVLGSVCGCWVADCPACWLGAGAVYGWHEGGVESVKIFARAPSLHTTHLPPSSLGYLGCFGYVGIPYENMGTSKFFS